MAKSKESMPRPHILSPTSLIGAIAIRRDKCFANMPILCFCFDLPSEFVNLYMGRYTADKYQMDANDFTAYYDIGYWTDRARVAAADYCWFNGSWFALIDPGAFANKINYQLQPGRTIIVHPFENCDILDDGGFYAIYALRN